MISSTVVHASAYSSVASVGAWPVINSGAEYGRDASTWVGRWPISSAIAWATPKSMSTARVKIPVHKDVGRLDVAVHDRAVVRVVQRVGDLLQCGKAFGHRLHVRDAATGDQFHRQPAGSACVHRHDVGMLQATGEFELAPQPSDLSQMAVTVVENLQRHLAIRVVRAVHRRVATVAERFVDDVAFKLLAGREHVTQTRGFISDIDLLRRLLAGGRLR